MQQDPLRKSGAAPFVPTNVETRFAGNAESPHDSEKFKTATRGTKFPDAPLQGKPETATIGGLNLRSVRRGLGRGGEPESAWPHADRRTVKKASAGLR